MHENLLELTDQAAEFERRLAQYNAATELARQAPAVVPELNDQADELRDELTTSGQQLRDGVAQAVEVTEGEIEELRRTLQSLQEVMEALLRLRRKLEFIDGIS